MSWKEIKKNSTQLTLPNRKTAVRRILIIAAVLFPLTWVVNALLVGSWNLLGDRNAESYRHLREAAVIFLGAVCVVFLFTLLPTTQRFFSLLFSRRTLRRCLIVFAWVVTLVALFYGEENWRGRRAWKNYRDTLIAQGVPLDFNAFVPKPIPDAENFAANPEVQSWFIRYTNGTTGSYTNVWESDAYTLASPLVASDGKNSGPEFRDTRNPVPHLTDLVAWKMAFASAQAGHMNERPGFKSEQTDPASRAEAALTVLDALKPIAPRLEELRAASSRPESVYPVVYLLDNPWGILLPHLADIEAVCLRLDLRACAELAAGQTDRALDDVKLNLRMADSLKSDTFLVSYLVRADVMHIAIHSIWEGLEEHKWSDAQLNELQMLLARYNLIADLKSPLDCERAAGILTADLLEQGKFAFTDIGANSAGNVFGRLIPGGWYNFEKLNYVHLYGVQLDGIFDATAKRVFPKKVAAGTNALDQAYGGRNSFTMLFVRHQLLSIIMLPALGNMARKAAIAQVNTDEALLACTLERYRLAHREYPDQLDALAPEFISTLPHDVISGQPYRYLRTKDEFLLYSVGWNEKDDGGHVGTNGRSTDITLGDWVWGIPPK